MKNISSFIVAIQVKTCSVEEVTCPLQKRFAAPKLDSKDKTIVVRDVAGVVTEGELAVVSFL